ncbi:MAG: 50S ribosomal protein L5 [Methanosarcinaceae archaeon]|nr:50S ribosomal protein L5 [Methanosarcinaceae archaeon]
MSGEMRTPRIDKVVVHMGVGESGQNLVNAEKILEAISEQTVIRTYAKKTLPEFSIKKNEPIGCKVTLRGEHAKEFLKTSFGIVENKLYESQFDKLGNVAFGIEEHTDYPGMRYDPNIGIYGLDVMVAVKRPGFRISKRKIVKRKVPTAHRVTKEDSISFFKEEFGVEIE